MGLAAIGVLTAAAGAFMAPDRMWASWLMVAYYALGLGLAGLCFVAIHYTTGSTWSVAFRRVPEALAGTLPFSLAMLAILFIVHPQLYGWTHDETPCRLRAALAFKHFWLSWPFFLVAGRRVRGYLDRVRVRHPPALAPVRTRTAIRDGRTRISGCRPRSSCSSASRSRWPASTG